MLMAVAGTILIHPVDFIFSPIPGEEMRVAEEILEL
jgi:hypothetical protein